MGGKQLYISLGLLDLVVLDTVIGDNEEHGIAQQRQTNEQEDKSVAQVHGALGVAGRLFPASIDPGNDVHGAEGYDSADQIEQAEGGKDITRHIIVNKITVNQGDVD